MFTTLELSVDKRGNKLFVDFSQNEQADTLASAYSLRPGKQPNVSTPLYWNKLEAGLKAEDFTMETIGMRLEKLGDLWKDIGSPKLKNANAKIMKNLLLGYEK